MTDSGLCFVEWAAPRGIDVTDPSLWASFMPALGRTIDPATVAADLATMTLSQWRRAYCNMWDNEADDDGWQVIARDVWQAARI